MLKYVPFICILLEYGIRVEIVKLQVIPSIDVKGEGTPDYMLLYKGDYEPVRLYNIRIRGVPISCLKSLLPSELRYQHTNTLYFV